MRNLGYVSETQTFAFDQQRQRHPCGDVGKGSTGWFTPSLMILPSQHLSF